MIYMGQFSTDSFRYFLTNPDPKVTQVLRHAAVSTIDIPEIPGTLAGAATIASLTPGVFMLEDRNDLVVSG